MEKCIYDCVVIGGGLSGIAAALRLSYFDKKVVLVEKNRNLGGLNTFYFRNGIEIDSGLHAITNFCKKGSDKSLPLNKLLRQLRIEYEDLELVEQIQSEIRFPATRIVFRNNFEDFSNTVKSLFPESAKGFEKFCKIVKEYDAFSLESDDLCFAREKMREFFDDRLLEDMILLPLTYYGNAMEYDMEFSQFVIMFRSIFMEGLCRPQGGIRVILELLEKKLLENNCEIRKSICVNKIISYGDVFELELSDGSKIFAKKVISSIGVNETKRALGLEVDSLSSGQMSFLEAIICVRDDFDFGNYRNACLFFCEKERFEYRRPQDAYSMDNGVLCCTENFLYRDNGKGRKKFLRLTVLANFAKWIGISEDEYARQKKIFLKNALEKIEKLVGIALKADDVILKEVYTPRTIMRWTGHDNGAIYGSFKKLRDGRLPVEGVYLCGTDQGFLGITGAILSGITIANKYLLT